MPRAAILITIVTFLCCVPIRAEDSSGFKIVQGKSWPAGTLDPAKAKARWSNYENQISEGTFDPDAAPLLRMAEDATRKVFNLENLTLNKAVTNRTQTGAEMTAKWIVSGGRIAGELIV